MVCTSLIEICSIMNMPSPGNSKLNTWNEIKVEYKFTKFLLNGIRICKRLMTYIASC